MSSDDFAAWMKTMGRGKPFSERAAARALGVSRCTVKAYRAGKRIPRQTALACAALAFGLPEWRMPEWRKAA